MYDVLVFDHRLAEHRPLDSKAELARLLFGYTTGNGQRFPAQPELVRFVARLLLVTAGATAAAALTAYLLHAALDSDAWLVAALRAMVVTAVDGVLFIVLARVFRLREVTAVLETVTRRLPVPRRR